MSAPKAKGPAELRAERQARKDAANAAKPVGESFRPAKSGRVVSHAQGEWDEASAPQRLRHGGFSESDDFLPPMEPDAQPVDTAATKPAVVHGHDTPFPRSDWTIRHKALFTSADTDLTWARTLKGRSSLQGLRSLSSGMPGLNPAAGGASVGSATRGAARAASGAWAQALVYYSFRVPDASLGAGKRLWREAFRSLFYSWRHGGGYFYIEARDFTVLWKGPEPGDPSSQPSSKSTGSDGAAPGGAGPGVDGGGDDDEEGWRCPGCAMVSRSSFALRTALAEARVAFDMPGDPAGTVLAADRCTAEASVPDWSVPRGGGDDGDGGALRTMVRVAGHTALQGLFEVLRQMLHEDRLGPPPLLLSRGPFLHATLAMNRVAFAGPVLTAQGTQRSHQQLEIRGVLLPCALRQVT